MRSAMSSRFSSLLLLIQSVAALRNVDRCEALIFTPAALISSESKLLRNGCARLLGDAAQQSTLIACVGPALPAVEGLPTSLNVVEVPANSGTLDYWAALCDARTSMLLTPDGFGGSDGFGRAPSAQERDPLPERCVVLVTTLAECDGALRAGMRAIGIPEDDGYSVDAEVCRRLRTRTCRRNALLRADARVQFLPRATISL